MKNWLRNKLRNWLGIDHNYMMAHDSHADITIIKEDIRKVKNRLYKLQIPQETIKQINITEGKINKLVDHFQLGVDIHPLTHGDSWAVFCIGGKMDYVRFVRLHHNDIRSLSQFIKQFPASREDKYMDLPHGMRKEFFGF